MTDTISRTGDDVEAATADAVDAAAPQVDHPEAVTPPWAAMPVTATPGGRECVDVDPTALIIGDNVRAAAHLDRQFLASLREFGVMNPIQATRDQNGTLTVKRGQRRTLGAVKAGLATVPVLVVADDTDEADRIVKQWHENERRDALTETDRLAAVEQLTILGVPAGNIARRLGTPKKQVEAAVQANGSETAKAAAAKHALTLTEAGLIAEFEDDQDTVRDILRAVKDGGSAEHVAQRARDDKARRQAHDEAVAALVEAGVTVIDRPGYGDKTIKELREIRLVKKDGEPKANPPTEKDHATCPGHAAYVTTYSSGTPHLTYVCTNPKANGHALYSNTTGGYNLTGGGTSGQPGGGMTEEQKAERRLLIARNREWESATVVRRAWLAESFLTRTTPPKGAETFLALAVAHGEHTEDSHETFANLTQAEDQNVPSYQRYSGVTKKIEAKADAASPRQVLMLAVALIVCEWESTLTRANWRRPQPRDRRYLTALMGWGYKPSEVERLILADTTPTDTGDPGVPTDDAEQTENAEQTEDGGTNPDDTEPGDARGEDAVTVEVDTEGEPVEDER